MELKNSGHPLSLRFLITVFCLALLICSPALAAERAAEDAFSPRQGATNLIVEEIGNAKQSIYVAAYSFTSSPIGEALVGAHRKGVEVKIVLDKRQNSKRSLAVYLQENGVETRLNHRYAIMHNKFMIIDGKTLELGSFNYTKAAEEKNAENVLVIHDNPKIVDDYTRQWEKLWLESAE